MKLLVTADLHLSSYRRELVDPLSQIKTALLEISSFVSNNSIDCIIIAGDIFHDKVYVYKNAFDTIEEFLVSTNVPIYLIAGNHDFSRHGCLIDMIPDMSNVTKVTKNPLRLENMLLVPWCENQLEAIYDNYNESDKILISHFGLNEAKLQSGISRIDPIRLRDLKPFEKVILGHYHLAQQVDKVVYVGNPAPLDWNDKNQEKRFVILDNETMEMQSIPVTSVRRFYEFHDPDEKELEKIKKLIDENHIVRVWYSNPDHNDKKIEGATIVYTDTINDDITANVTDVFEIAKELVDDHPKKKQLLESLDEIRRTIPKVTEGEENEVVL